MKKTFYILALMLSAFFSLSTTLFAQTPTSTQEFNFYVYPNDGAISGDMNFVSSDVFRNYLYYVNSIKRVDDKTLILKSKDYPGAKIKDTEIRLQVDKGRLTLYRINEGEYDNPIKLGKWNVNQLNKDEKEVIISIYHNSTNNLLAQMKCALTPYIQYVYTAKLLYTDLKGNEQVLEKPISKSKINMKKPIKVVVNDGWSDTTCVVQGFTLKDYSKHLHPWNAFTGNELSPDVFNKFTLGDIYWIEASFLKNGNPTNANPIRLER